MNKLELLLRYFIESPRPIKRLVSLIIDSNAVLASILVSQWAIGLFALGLSWHEFFYTTITLFFSIAVFIRLGFYRAILRYIGINAIGTILVGVTLSATIYAASMWIVKHQINVNLILFYWCFLLVTVGGARLALRAYIETISEPVNKVIIYGAGAAGRQLASVLRYADKYCPLAFVDDDIQLQGSDINGLKVISPNDMGALIVEYSITHVFLALPSVSHERRGEILTYIEPFPVEVKTIAGMEDIVSGKVKIEELKDIEIEDLLGRDPVGSRATLMRTDIFNKVVMVTGAGGSIGSELCRQLIKYEPKMILLYEISEYGLYFIEKELRKVAEELGYVTDIRALIGSVQHKNRLTKTMKSFEVNTVYHAAAYKHVPIVENNIIEGIRNNVFGTWYAAEAAIEAEVQKFVLISTDKAVRPTNVMGASKRLAELVLQALNLRQSKTVFTMVRFGNVLGSSGSVVPLFREQIHNGGPVTVTHPDIIRYFMTIPEASQLVIQAGAMGKGGDVFVLDMGEPVKIAFLAEKMIHLMGRTIKSKENPKGDIEIKYTGLRPGEKLYEELLIGDNVAGTSHPRIMSANEDYLSWNEMDKALRVLGKLCDEMNCMGIVQLLLRLPLGYNPQHAVCDLLWEVDQHYHNDEMDNQNDSDIDKKVVQFKTLS